MDEDPRDAMFRRRARREELIEQVARGRAPELAERDSLAEGHGPLINNPTFTDIDGYAEPRWTLLMAFAWAAWGQNPDHVRLYFSGYRHRCRVWRPLGAGHVRAPMEIWNAYTAIKQLRDDEEHNDIEQIFPESGKDARLAWDRLQAKFRSGEIETYGQLVNDTQSGINPIPPVNWQGLRLMQPTGLLVDPLCYADNQPVYFNVTVDRSLLLASYPAKEQEPMIEAKPKRGPAPMDNTPYIVRMKALFDAAQAKGEKMSINRAATIATKEGPRQHSENATRKRISKAFSLRYPHLKQGYHRDN